MVTTGRLGAALDLVRGRRGLDDSGALVNWCDGVPALLADLVGRWHLTVEGDQVWAGFGGIALPVSRADREPAVLKMTFSQQCRDVENDVLARWAGDGAAVLLERDDHRHGRLLERLRRPSLAEHADPVEAMAIAGALAARLAVDAPPDLPHLSDIAVTAAAQISGFVGDLSGLTRFALAAAAATYRELGPDQPETLLHGDLHGSNILCTSDGRWAAIDPLGVVGEVATEALTALRDRWTALPATASPRSALLDQLQAFADGAEVPVERVLAWTQARSVRAVVAGVDDDHGLHAWVASELTAALR